MAAKSYWSFPVCVEIPLPCRLLCFEFLMCAEAPAAVCVCVCFFFFFWGRPCGCGFLCLCLWGGGGGGGCQLVKLFTFAAPSCAHVVLTWKDEQRLLEKVHVWVFTLHVHLHGDGGKMTAVAKAFRSCKPFCWNFGRVFYFIYLFFLVPQSCFSWNICDMYPCSRRPVTLSWWLM